MFDYRLVRTVSIIGAIFFGIVAGMNILDWYNEVSDWCQNGPAIKCVQDWVGATSGWAAAMVAFATIWFLKGQIFEQKKQTDFTIGDTPPTAYLFDPRETNTGNAFSNRLEIVNWNRHPILIQAIELIEPHKFDLMEVSIEDHDVARKRKLQSELERGRLFIPGWLDRSKSPTFTEFNIIFGTSDPDIKASAFNSLARHPIDIKISLTINVP